MSPSRITFGFFVIATTAALAACGGHSATPTAPTLVEPAVFSRQAVPAPAVTGTPIAIVGTGSNPTLDNDVVAFMVAHHVRNAELAVSNNGTAVLSHAYTYTSIAPSTTTTQTIMRLASITKAWTSAALYNLILANKISTSTPIFKYLGITKPLPTTATVDPRVYTITIQNMIDHESGWDDGVSPYYDPTFNMRQEALAVGLTHEIGLTDYVRYQLPQPLQEAPGTTYAYCNFCYTVLGMVVAKASGMSYDAYIAQVAAGVGVNNVLSSPTVGARLPNEVAKYYSPYTGLSAVYVTSSKLYGDPYGGDDMALEVAQGASALATNAESMLALMNKYLIWGVGPPQPGADWARSGSMEGTSTWAEQMPNGMNYAFLINTRQFSNPNTFTDLQNKIRQVLDPGIPPFLKTPP
ncbi:MAG TPA: serine hydrolase domain-containing protein [Candidatus Baltobacteraceae bacterium]|nr:serine hydrolase domain-containing protein [Candidatus Baltobacteraceae bacterium]